MRHPLIPFAFVLLVTVLPVGVFSWVFGHYQGRTGLALHTRVVILDVAKPNAGPWIGKCLELYDGHPVCAVDDRLPLNGLFYPAIPAQQ